jgi:pimeloyl-ACP methyl ester carboxylesterase
MQAYKSQFIDTNGIKLHYIEYPRADKPLLLLMHGLTANSLAFNGLIEAGLNEHWHILSVDFRGRGQSSKKTFQYSIRHHALDIIGLLDHLKIPSIALVGHSFGGLMSTYLAYHFPERVHQLFILDAAPVMNPKAAQMLMPAVGRIDKRYSSFDEYLAALKASEYMLEWDDAMLPYYKADVRVDDRGNVECISDMSDIIQISTHVSMEPWSVYFSKLKQRTTLFVAQDAYTLGEPLLTEQLATRTFATMRNASYVRITGNHQTMLFGMGAAQIVAEMHT